MTAATHRIGGAAMGLGLVVYTHANATDGALIVGASILGSILPDIDNPHSSISYKWRGISWIVTISQMLIRGISHLFPKKQAAYIRSLIGHRGLTHSLAPVMVLAAIGVLCSPWAGHKQIGYYIASGLAGGILSHIAFDMLAGGAPLFMPFSTKRICLAHIKTGGIAEKIFRTCLIIFFTGLGLEVITAWLK